MGFEDFPVAVNDHSTRSNCGSKAWNSTEPWAGLEYERRNDLNAEVFAELLPIVGFHQMTLKPLVSASHPLLTLAAWVASLNDGPHLLGDFFKSSSESIKLGGGRQPWIVTRDQVLSRFGEAP